jgi:hypothetical protein
MIHPDTCVKPTPKGLGMFAKRPFRRGEILWIADDFDVKIPLAEYETLNRFERKKLDVYSYLDSRGRVIIAWDEGKYVNHSCSPNSTGLLEFDNISIALRDIAAGEEIVEDYYSYFGHFERFTCQCGAPNCRGEIRDTNSYEPTLRLSIHDVAPLLRSLPQLLLQVQSEENRELMELLQGELLPSPNGRVVV